jgi:carboxyl-terminal processing protease
MNDIRCRFNIKKNNYNLLTIILIVIVVALFSSAVTGITIYFMNNKNVILSDEEKELLNVYNNIKNTYYISVDSDTLVDAAIEGMIDSLGEDYTEVLNSAESSLLSDKLDGSYQGIGIVVGISDNNIIVKSVTEDSPASKSGILVNDIILSINNTEVNRDNYYNISELITENEQVTLSIKRDDEIIEKNVAVETLDKPSITSKIIEKNGKSVGYIYIETFSNTTDKQFDAALKSLESEGIDSLIIDVRNNTGGYLDVAKSICSMFIIKGKTIYQLKTQNSVSEVVDTTSESRDYDVVVLINGKSASASEVLALALKESYGAIIVGTTSYGKGSVQQLDNTSSSTIKLTTAKWYSPLGNTIDGIGITPSVNIELSSKYANNPTEENDEQLQKSLEILTIY